MFHKYNKQMKIEDGIYSEIIKEDGVSKEEGIKQVGEKASALIDSYKTGEGVLFWYGEKKALLHVIGSNRMAASSVFKQMLLDLEVSEEVISRAKSICVASIEAKTRLSILTRLKNFVSTLKPEIANKSIEVFDCIASEAKSPKEDPKSEREVVFSEIVKSATQSVPDEVSDELKQEYAYRRIKLIHTAITDFVLKGP